MNFPYEPEQLTTEWLTEILHQAGVLNRARVKSFEVKPLLGIQGTFSQNSIIAMTYDRVEKEAPQSVFAKFAKSDSQQRANIRDAYEQEVQFYQQFAHRVDFLTPRAYFSAFDKTTGYFILLLEDCSDGEIGDRVTGCSVERTQLILAEIAKFHAAWWEHPELTRYSWSRTQDPFLNRIQEIYAQFTDILEIPRDPELLRTIKEHSTQFSSWMRYLQQAPYTLIHNDYQLDNLIFFQTDSKTTMMVLDWQWMSIGRGVLDVADFLGGNISIEDRRNHEKDLLKLYHDTLCENGVTYYPFDQCWEDYRMAMLDGLWRNIIPLGHGRMREAQHAAHRDVIAPRFFAAVLDLDCREMLGQLT